MVKQKNIRDYRRHYNDSNSSQPDFDRLRNPENLEQFSIICRAIISLAADRETMDALSQTISHAVTDTEKARIIDAATETLKARLNQNFSANLAWAFWDPLRQKLQTLSIAFIQHMPPENKEQTLSYFHPMHICAALKRNAALYRSFWKNYTPANQAEEQAQIMAETLMNDLHYDYYERLIGILAAEQGRNREEAEAAVDKLIAKWESGQMPELQGCEWIVSFRPRDDYAPAPAVAE